MRYQVVTDGLTTRPRFDRRYAVIDNERMGSDGLPLPVLQTDDARRASDYCDELNQSKSTVPVSPPFQSKVKLIASDHEIEGIKKIKNI